MKVSPSARRWIAAGVRHELLLRALPALRHDLVAPVTPMRMSLLLLKRQLAAPAPDAAACAQRAAQIDAQLGEVVDGVRALRDWELANDGTALSRAALVRQCLALMRPAFDLHAIALEVDAALEVDFTAERAAGTGDARVWRGATAAQRYLLLGCLGHLQDTAIDVGAIHIAPERDTALQLRARRRSGDSPAPGLAQQRARRRLAIDAASLQSLADDLGLAITIERDAVRLDLRGA